MPTAVIAEENILLKHGVTLLQFNSSLERGISYRGWTFRSFLPLSFFSSSSFFFLSILLLLTYIMIIMMIIICYRSYHDKMADEQELINLQVKISNQCHVDSRDDDVIVIDGHNLHIPPMIFLKDILSIKHELSSTQFDFNAADAICSWAIKHTKPDLEILEVPYAKNWTVEQTNEMKQHKWDWTYCSDYNCTITSSITELSSVIVNEGKIIGSSISIPSSINSSNVINSQNTSSSDSTNFDCIHLSETSPGGIDLNLLRAQDDILFYDDFILYQVNYFNLYFSN